VLLPVSSSRVYREKHETLICLPPTAAIASQIRFSGPPGDDIAGILELDDRLVIGVDPAGRQPANPFIRSRQAEFAIQVRTGEKDCLLRAVDRLRGQRPHENNEIPLHIPGSRIPEAARESAHDDLQIFKGTVEIATGSTLTTYCFIGYTTTQSTDVNLTIAAGVTINCDIYVGGGATECNSASANGIHIFAGSWTHEAGNLSGVVRVYGSGTFNWNGGTVTNALVFGGVFSAADSPLARTLTSARLYLGAAMDLNNGIGNITLTNGVESNGGTLTVIKGEKLS